MKTKITFIITLLLSIHCFSQTAECGTILNETFSEGTLPSGWTEYNTSGRVTVEAGKLKFNHNSTRPSVYHTFSPVTSNSNFSFDVSASRSSVNCQIHLVSSKGKYLSSIAVGVQTASIKYATSISSGGVPSGFTDGDPLVSLKTNTDYAVSAKVDFPSKTVNFYADGVLMAADIPFLEAAEDIAKIDIQLIYMWSNTGQFYFDNFSLVSGDENRLLLTNNTAAASTLINDASIGTNYNQYPQAAADAFQQAIDNANTVLANCESASNSIDDAVTNLQAAQDSFIAARINGLALSLRNDTGIIEDNLGSVIRWENQVEGFGDATQSNSSLGGDILYETYPGKVNVGFSKDGSFLELEDTNAIITDNSYSVFYVGKGSPTERQAALIGNFNINGAWGDSSGARFVKNPEGVISMQYGAPSLQTEVFSTVPSDGFFFFGFTMDSSGNYKYFDNTSPFVKEGKLSKIIKTNNDNLKLNLYEDIDGPKTYAHTEVVELSMYDGKLSDLDFQDQFSRLSTEYAELVKGEFSVTEVLPAVRTNLPVTSSITVTCDQPIEPTSVFPKIYINKSETAVAGNWVLSPTNTLTFTPNENWPYKALVTVEIDEGLKSTDDVSVDISKGTKYNFIVETDEDYGPSENITFTSIATVDFPQAGHTLGLKMNLPTNREHKVPVHFWVHGGGWSGGTPEASAGSTSPHGEYLAENLGIATLGIGYRCSGSSGTFSLAMEDVAAAYQWALDNADTYNFDMTKVFFSGGSAGTPLAALASQQLPNVIGFIGFNGIYDFVNDAGDFGVGNWYKQNVPSETANSPIFNLATPPPATIMMHGDADTTISHTQSTLFADAINANGGEAEAVIYPGEVHAFFNPGKPAYEDVLIEMVNFINGVLNKQALADALSQKYVNDMDYVLGDTKQAFITNKITTEAKADNLLLGFKNMGVNGIRIPIFGRGEDGVDLNPNKEMFDYFYAQAIAQGYPIFANPAQGGGGVRIANNMLNGNGANEGEEAAVKNVQAATDELVNRIIEFSNEYPECKWINPFNEDGRATNSTWSVSQINEIYRRLYEHGLNGAELIGPCTWGLPAGIDMLQNTNIAAYITVAASHNLGFHHSEWSTFIALAKADGFPVWDSEVNHNDAKGTGTRLEKAIENKVDGLVLYNSWNTVNLETGGVNATGQKAMALYLAPLVNIAPYGTATQSSVGYSGATADKAIDGNTDGALAANSLSIISGTDAPPYWEVDLGSDKEIAYIKLYNRTDSCCKNRLESFTVYVSDSEGETTYSKSYTSYPDPFISIEINETGQVVRIESNATDNTGLNIAEVQVYEKNSVSWNGSVSSDWTDGDNWSSGKVPTLINPVTIPSGMPNQPVINAVTGIELNSLTVIPGAILTVESGGSLIVNTTSVGDVTYQLTVNDTNWHLLASPLVAETYNTAWVDANLIDNTTRTVGTNVGIATYNNNSTAGAAWVYTEDGDTGTFNTGQGYSIKRDATGSDISFTGSVQTASFSPAITAYDIDGANENRWTLIGNPYPSYISVNSLLTLSANSIALEDSREAIYVFDNNKVGGAGYVAQTTGYIHPGQGFFVNSNSISTSLTIQKDMLSHQSGVTFYKNTPSSTSINLIISDGKNSKATEINYVEGTTTGLDPRFDIGTFNGDASATAFTIYSQLVTDNLGVNFVKQSLPNADYENMIIPIGVNAAKGKEITFSAEAFNLPDELNIFLEDKAKDSFTRLDKENASYKITLSEKLNGIGRFYVHTSTQSVLGTDTTFLESVSIYKVDNTTLRAVGLFQGNTSVKLFNILGKEIISRSFIANGVKDISLPKLATGIYIVKLETETGKLNKKIIIE